MPPNKRKAPGKSNTTNNGNNALTPPDRNTWPGWVEMESEPAFFNVMLKDMGVHGVKTSEVWSLDDNELVVLPQPVHALIFLFRYRETNKDDLETECPAGIWYAEQVPDYACATVALLNIVNNIPGLEMGKDLRNFKQFTQEMTPRLRGEAIDDFTFVKQIHNSFARESDILQADMIMKEKAAKARKRQAVAKAQKTKAENAAKRKAQSKASPVETPKSTRTSRRVSRSTTKPEDEESPRATPQSAQSSEKASEISPAKAQHSNVDENGTPSKKVKSPSDTPSKTNGTATPIKKIDSPAVATTEIKDSDGEASESEVNETPSKPTANTGKKLKLNAPKTKAKPDTNAEFTASVEDEPSMPQPRRSAREPKPRKDFQPATQEAESEDDDEEGFHFCAYMPIGDRVWKLDGMDKFPQDMGPTKEGESWLGIAQPILQDRMAQYAASEIQFNIMAVVHDPMVGCVEALAANVKALHAVDEKLTGVVEDWREMLDDESSETLLGQSHELGLLNVDIERAEMTPKDVMALAEAEDLSQLLELRKEITLQQCGLRHACSDELSEVKKDAEKAKNRRHDYSTFAREWLGALAEQEVLGALAEEES